MKVKTDAPKEDPAVTAARERETARADAAYINNTQTLLDDETRKRARRFGQRVALTGANPAGSGGMGGSVASATGVQSSGSFIPLASVNGAGVSIV